MTSLIRRVGSYDIDDAVLSFLKDAKGSVTMRQITIHLQRKFRVELYQAWNAATYSTMRLRARGDIALSGRAKGARYSLTEKVA